MTKVKTQSNLSKNLKTLTETSPTKSKVKPEPKTKVKTKNTPEEIKAVRSADKTLFPHVTFPYRLDDKKENKVCWFSCYHHAEKYITRYRLSSKEYKLWHCPNLLKNP